MAPRDLPHVPCRCADGLQHIVLVVPLEDSANGFAAMPDREMLLSMNFVHYQCTRCHSMTLTGPSESQSVTSLRPGAVRISRASFGGHPQFVNACL